MLLISAATPTVSEEKLEQLCENIYRTDFRTAIGLFRTHQSIPVTFTLITQITCYSLDNIFQALALSTSRQLHIVEKYSTRTTRQIRYLNLQSTEMFTKTSRTFIYFSVKPKFKVPP